ERRGRQWLNDARLEAEQEARLVDALPRQRPGTVDDHDVHGLARAFGAAAARIGRHERGLRREVELEQRTRERGDLIQPLARRREQQLAGRCRKSDLVEARRGRPLEIGQKQPVELGELRELILTWPAIGHNASLFNEKLPYMVLKYH